MKFKYSELPKLSGRNVAAIGVFDGVHLGHQHILREAVALRETHDSNVFAVTFDPHPMTVVRPGTEVSSLTAPKLKEELIKEIGVDEVVFLDFDLELQMLEAEEFIEQVLVESLSTFHVVVGADFRFGRGARGNLDLLRSYIGKGLSSVQGVDLISDAEGPIKSTRVRSEIESGNLKRAKALMGRNLRITGRVVHGFGRGERKVGFATANIDTPEVASIPANGVYAGLVWYNGGRYKAAVNVGTSPTFEDRKPRREVQAHLIDEEVDIYGREIELEFIDRLRDEKKFSSVDELRMQIAKDVEQAREILQGSL